jgi:hypothetical protein
MAPIINTARPGNPEVAGDVRVSRNSEARGGAERQTVLRRSFLVHATSRYRAQGVPLRAATAIDASTVKEAK